MTPFPEEVRVVEVGPRDGLQNESRAVATDVKVAFIRKLLAAGCREVEIGAFVRPDRVLQMADSAEVAEALRDVTGARLSALVPNERGLERALAAGVRRIALFTAASETFTQRNIGMGIDESLRTFAAVAAGALAAGASVRGYVSTAFTCPYEGAVDAEAVRRVSLALLEMGADEVSLGDTIGVAAPGDVYRLLEVLLPQLPVERLALHFHDTSGTALANVLAGLHTGVTTFDSAAGGLGGCPFAPGAAGNLATEDLLYMLERTGIRTGIRLEAVAEASRSLEAHLGHPLPGRMLQRLRSMEGGGSPQRRKEREGAQRGS
jgi:hydroxymethylglutaryl-CoA lyase